MRALVPYTLAVDGLPRNAPPRAPRRASRPALRQSGRAGEGAQKRVPFFRHTFDATVYVHVNARLSAAEARAELISLISIAAAAAVVKVVAGVIIRARAQ